MNTETAKKATGKPLIKSRTRDRSVKDRPQDVGELISAIDNGRLDGRTAPAKRITALRSAIASAPLEAARGVIRDALAVNLVIAQAITAEVSRPGFQVLLPDGGLNPLLAGHWQETQKSLLNAARLLIQTETKVDAEKAASGANRGTSGDFDISALVMEASDEDDKPS